MTENNIKKNGLIIHETQIIQLIIANLANNDLDLLQYDELIEYYDTNDTKIKFDHFINLFFDNNTHSFEINDQYRYSPELLINNKIIRSLFKNYTHNNLTILDIIKTQHIKNKKIKISESKSLSLISHINKHNSLFDFKIYKSTLSLDDILYIFNNKPNKNNKKYFRFKIIVNYHYNDINENVSICFNYLTKIPASFKSKKIDKEYLFSNLNNIINDDDDVDDEPEKELFESYQEPQKELFKSYQEPQKEPFESYQEEESNNIFSNQSNNCSDKSINSIIDDKNYINFKEENQDNNKKYFSHENIIYSNYKKKNLTNSSFYLENFSIDTENSTITTEDSTENSEYDFNNDFNKHCYEKSNVELTLINKENNNDAYSNNSETEYIDDDETENDYDTDSFNNFDIDNVLNKYA
jgi:hypothetical protein